MSRWKMIKLGTIGDFKSGGTPTRSKPEFFEGNIPWITTISLGKTFIDESDAVEYISQEAVANSATKIIIENSIMLGIRVGVGKVSINTVPMCTNQDIVSIENIDEKEIFKPYIVHCIKSYSRYFDTQKRGATIQGINSGVLKSLDIPIPPLETQKIIAKTLDTAAELLAMRKQQLAELDNLIKSIFYDMFGDPDTNEKGWEFKTLQQLIDDGYITGHLDGNHGSLYPKNSEFVDCGVPYIGANCIETNRVNFSKSKYLSRERASKFKKGVSKNGDVLFAHNATVGPVAILETQEEYTILSTSLTYYRCDLDLLNNYYLMCYMKTPYFVSQYIKIMGQTTRNQVPITAQKSFLHMIPPLPLQKQFTEIVTKIEEQKTLVKKAIGETQYLFDSLMSEYFE